MLDEDGTADVVWRVEDFPVADRAEIEESLRTHGAAMVLRVGSALGSDAKRAMLDGRRASVDGQTLPPYDFVCVEMPAPTKVLDRGFSYFSDRCGWSRGSHRVCPCDLPLGHEGVCRLVPPPRSVASNDSSVWLPAVPLPLLGILVDRCRVGSCRHLVFGRDRRRKYELHWRTEHEPLALVSCPRREASKTDAAKILAAVASQDWRMLP